MIRIYNRFKQQCYVRRKITVLLFLLLQLSHADAIWLASVDSNPFSADILVLADSSGCITFLDGYGREIYELNGATFHSIGGGDQVCVDGPAVLRIIATPESIIEMPEAAVSRHSIVLSRVWSTTVANKTILSVEPDYFAVLALVAIISGISVAIAFAVRRRAGKRIDGDNVEQSIIRYVASHPGASQKEIARALGLKKYQISRILSRMEEQGIVVRVRRGISKRIYLPEQLQ